MYRNLFQFHWSSIILHSTSRCIPNESIAASRKTHKEVSFLIVEITPAEHLHNGLALEVLSLPFSRIRLESDMP